MLAPNYARKDESEVNGSLRALADVSTLSPWRPEVAIHLTDRCGRRSRKREHASTLVISVFIIALLALLIGAAFDFTRGTAYVARRGRDMTAAQALADGALEVAFKKWQIYMAANQSSVFATASSGTFASAADFKTKIGDPTTSLLATNAASSGFKVTEINISPVDQADNPQQYQSTSYATVGPLSSVPGWIAKAYSYRARAVVRSVTDPSVVVSVSRYFQEAEASLFQALLFFQNDLELHPGPNMTLYGLVHTNSNLYAVAGAGGGLTFSSNVSYVGNTSTFAPASQHPTNFYENPNGYAEGVTQTLYNQESGTGTRTKIRSTRRPRIPSFPTWKRRSTRWASTASSRTRPTRTTPARTRSSNGPSPPRPARRTPSSPTPATPTSSPPIGSTTARTCASSSTATPAPTADRPSASTNPARSTRRTAPRSSRRAAPGLPTSPIKSSPRLLPTRARVTSPISARAAPSTPTPWTCRS